MRHFAALVVALWMAMPLAYGQSGDAPDSPVEAAVEAADATEAVMETANVATPTLGIPKHRLYYSNAVFARVNPLGLINQLTMGWRYRLIDADPDSTLFGDTYTLLGLSSRASPAFGRIGVHAEIMPIAVFRAWVDYEFVGFFGTFDQVAGFDSASAMYSDQTLRALDRKHRAIGTVLTTGAVLQGKVGPVAIRSTFQATRFDIGLEDADDNFFYDQYWDRLAPNRQFMFLNDFDVLGLFGPVRVGARWTWSDALVGDNDTDAGLAHHRVGPLFAYTFHDRGPGARFNQPTIFLLTQWWAQHPYRAGQEQPQGLPLIALGFAFNGDLMGPRPERM
ncbi:MAG: hypothetical protein ACON5B_13095 [Myxococcota bacterium]